jgi:Zn-dependent protease
MFSNLGAGDIITVFVALLLSISIHEAMHAFAAHALGDSTAKDEGRLTLNPIKHIDLITTVLLPVVLIALHLPAIFIAKPVPFDPDRVRYQEFGAALVALAGPFTNLVLAIFTSFIIRFAAAGSAIEAVHPLLIFMQINIALFVFNMIPIPPLDGSRLVYAFAPEPVQRVMQQIEAAGFMFIIVIFLLLSPILMPIVGNVTEAIFTFLLR